jgi:hypothetical protein
MTYNILLLVTRNPAITPAEFKSHWEKHIELLKQHAGEHFPISHTRRCISRPEKVSDAWQATVLAGSQEDFAYDGVAEIVFEDEAAFQTFMGTVSAPEAAAALAEDEEKFIVREKLKAVVIGDRSVTERQ